MYLKDEVLVNKECSNKSIIKGKMSLQKRVKDKKKIFAEKTVNGKHMKSCSISFLITKCKVEEHCTQYLLIWVGKLFWFLKVWLYSRICKYAGKEASTHCFFLNCFGACYTMCCPEHVNSTTPCLQWRRSLNIFWKNIAVYSECKAVYRKLNYIQKAFVT